MIKVCADLGMQPVRVEGRSGVWGPGSAGRPARKVAAIGVRVSRATTLHGFALNCDCDLDAYTAIVPCGISDAGVTSLSAELRHPVAVDDVRTAVAGAVCDALDSGHLWGAGFDVFPEEPIPAHSRLLTTPHIVMTPHIAGASKQTAEKAARIAAGEVRRFLNHEPLEHCVNPEAVAGRP